MMYNNHHIIKKIKMIIFTFINDFILMIDILLMNINDCIGIDFIITFDQYSSRIFLRAGLNFASKFLLKSLKQ